MGWVADRKGWRCETIRFVPILLLSLSNQTEELTRTRVEQLNCRNFDQIRNKLDNYPLNRQEVQSISLLPVHLQHHQQRRHRLEGSRVGIGREMIGMRVQVEERKGADGIMGVEQRVRRGRGAKVLGDDDLSAT